MEKEPNVPLYIAVAVIISIVCGAAVGVTKNIYCQKDLGELKAPQSESR